VKKAKTKKGTLVNRSQKKISGYAWRKMFNRLKAEVGQVIGFGLDQLPSAGFRGVRLGRFLSKPKPVCEMMGSGFVKGDTSTDVSLGSRLVEGPRLSSDPESTPSLEVVVSSSSKVMTFSSTTRDLEVRQSGSSQVRSTSAGRCDSTPVVAKDTFMVSAVEDVAQSSQVFENPVAPRFVFPPLPTSSADPLFAATGFFTIAQGYCLQRH
jgi:hypothetical protein